jgi:hypothetical protein
MGANLTPLLTYEAVVSDDTDFQIYRKHKRQVIPLLAPSDVA